MEDGATQPVCYLSTRGRVTGREHTIEIWYVEHGGCVYLLSGYGHGADWVKNLLASPQVTLQLAPDGPGGQRSSRRAYAADAGPIEDDTRVREAMEARYHGWRPELPLSPWAAGSLVVRLRPVGA
jgi:deazaflavin-dependent oxidoreductase (nitroreductase family)